MSTALAATGQIEGVIGETFEAGKMGADTIDKDPNRENGSRALMGPFTIYTKDNAEAAAL